MLYSTSRSIRFTRVDFKVTDILGMTNLRRLGFQILVATLAALPMLTARPARAETPLTLVRVASGLSLPLFVAAPPGDTSRVFIVEQREPDSRGYIKILKGGIVLSTPFLGTGTLAASTEQGLLGLAFAPDYATSGRFYIDYTDSIGDTTVERRTVSGNPDVATATGQLLLSIRQP